MAAYLDHAASSPLRPEVAEAVAACWPIANANPLSTHGPGRAARDLLEDARERIGAALGVPGSQVTLTSGATESVNIAVIGAAVAMRGRHGEAALVACPTTEHAAVLGAVRHVGHSGLGESVELEVDAEGAVDHASLAERVANRVAVVSVMAVNNETGVRHDLAAVEAAVRGSAREVALHTDAVQGFAYDDAVVNAAAGFDLVTIAGHKLGGPRGIGALAVRRPELVEQITFGGSSETPLRPGTPDLPAAVGLAVAVELAAAEREAEAARLGALRERLLAAVTSASDLVEATARNAPHAPHLLHLVTPGVRSEELLVLLDAAGVAASSGAACTSGANRGSAVLVAMGADADRARSALRLSLGWSTTSAEVDEAASAIVAAVGQLAPPGSVG